MAILECGGLSKRFGSVAALADTSLAIEPGRIVGLLGPNGSGKTTLLKLACGLLTPTGGQVLVNGMTPCPESKAAVSYLPERNALPLWMRISALVDFYGDFYTDFRPDKAMEMLRTLKIDPSRPLRTLSKGNREKVQLILTMSRAAKLYLLDEPIGGVDPATRDYILQTIIGNYSEDAAVVISTHLIADVEPVLDEAVFLKDGSIYLHDSADALREAHGKSVDALFREVFKC
ncbi:MAG: ABC transporter ATP-binding protein [Clostridiaceae bacterium]|nr:ABC transporter ATP-binding protein [Clostridiaceae bacterium]